MNIHEAIEILNRYDYSTRLELSEGLKNRICDSITVDEFFKMKELATKSMQKQVPEKPYYLQYGADPKIGNWNHGMACICQYKEKHCSNCGKKLDWSDVD